MSSVLVHAQTLEHTYNTAIGLFKVDFNECVYTNFNEATKTLKIYDINHSLLKTIVINTNDTDIAVGYVSKKLFNQDNQFEFLLTSTSPSKSVKIYNEQGNAIFTKNSNTYIGVSIQNTQAGTKMIVNSSTVNGSIITPYVEIYSLTGELFWIFSPTQPEPLIEDRSFAYPNPTDGYLIIPGESNSTVRIFNINGSLVEEYKCTENCTFNTYRLSPGEYIYEVNGLKKGRFIKL